MRRRLCPKEALFTPSFIAVCSANLLFFIASFMMVPVLPIYLLDGLHASKSCSPPSLRDTCCSTRWRSWASSGHCTA